MHPLLRAFWMTYVNVDLSAPFDLDAQHRAYDEWGSNCGPGAIAAVLGMTLAELRPHLGDFEAKRYTNPQLMFTILRNLRIQWTSAAAEWPDNGLVRVQWEGPWTRPGVPLRARYRHSHWVGARCMGDANDRYVFDINCICVGGWVPFAEWRDQVVPWLLRQCEPKASGAWHITHALRIDRA